MNSVSNVTLDTCEKEAIHIPGLIQSYAYLLVVDGDRKVIGYSENILALLGIKGEQLINSALGDLAPLGGLPTGEKLHKGLVCSLEVNGQLFSVHATQPPDSTVLLCLEFEPAVSNLPRLQDKQSAIQRIVNRLGDCDNLTHLFDTLVIDLHSLLGFDRCMVYQFDKDWNGSVIAEEKMPYLEGFKGLHYPHTDIPKQARALYTKQLTRMICDVNYSPVNIVTSEVWHGDIDLTYVDARSISPMHIQYLQNMGVKATFVLSIMVSGKLWGLIACHNYESAKYLNYSERQSCETIAMFTSLFIEKLQNAEVSRNQERVSLEVTTSSIMGFLESAGSESEVVEQLLTLSECDSLAWVEGEAVFSYGDVPTREVIEALYRLHKSSTQELTAIDCLKNLPLIHANLNGCAGCCILPVSRQSGDDIANSYMILFRKAVTSIVNWAGNPNEKEYKIVNDAATLSPRRSFALWQEKMRDKCTDWEDKHLLIIKQLHVLLIEGYLTLIQKRRAHELQLIAETSDIGLWSIDLQSGVLNWSESMFHIYGVSKQDFDYTYEMWRNAVVETSRDQVAASFERCIHEKRPFQATFSIVNPEKGMRLIRAHGKVVLSDTGSVVRVIGTNVDITSNIDDFNTLATKDMRQIEQSKLASLGQMAATIGHEINNPLAIIISSLELQAATLAENGLQSGSIAEHNVRALTASARIQKIVAGLRNLTRRPDANSAAATCNASTTIEELIGLMSEIMRAKQVTITYQSTFNDIWVKIDRSVLEQVMVNLITNAADAMEGKDNKDITITTERVEQRFVIHVSDNGVGIYQADIGRIFQPFYTTKASGKGTGLGLSVSRQLLRDCGGDLDLTTVRGKGSTFSIQLHCAEEQPQESKTPQVSAEVARTSSVLLVDDEKDILEVLRGLIEALGCQVTAVDSGETALSLVNSQHFDVLIVDSQMAPLTGEQVISQIPPSVQIQKIMMTGDVTKSVESLREEGVVVSQLLYKPFNMNKLKEALSGHGLCKG